MKRLLNFIWRAALGGALYYVFIYVVAGIGAWFLLGESGMMALERSYTLPVSMWAFACTLIFLGHLDLGIGAVVVPLFIIYPLDEVFSHPTRLSSLFISLLLSIIIALLIRWIIPMIANQASKDLRKSVILILSAIPVIEIALRGLTQNGMNSIGIILILILFSILHARLWALLLR